MFFLEPQECRGCLHGFRKDRQKLKMVKTIASGDVGKSIFSYTM
jgi:hypothetical protein